MTCKQSFMLITWISFVPTICPSAQLSTNSSKAKHELMDEVIIHGTSLHDLKAAVVAAEDRFYDRYNELNKADDFDIECEMDTRTGAKIPQRRCLTRLQLAAKSRNGEETLQMFQEQVSGPKGHPGRPPNTDPQGLWLSRYDEYKVNMLYLLKMNPDLRQLVRDRDEAQARFDTEYKRRLESRTAPLR
jgi:hypothetical protein